MKFERFRDSFKLISESSENIKLRKLRFGLFWLKRACSISCVRACVSVCVSAYVCLCAKERKGVSWCHNIHHNDTKQNSLCVMVYTLFCYGWAWTRPRAEHPHLKLLKLTSKFSKHKYFCRRVCDKKTHTTDTGAFPYFNKFFSLKSQVKKFLSLFLSINIDTFVVLITYSVIIT